MAPLPGKGRGGILRQLDPGRNREVPEVAAREEQPGDDAHRLLRVVGAVIQRERRS